VQRLEFQRILRCADELVRDAVIAAVSSTQPLGSSSRREALRRGGLSSMRSPLSSMVVVQQRPFIDETRSLRDERRACGGMSMMAGRYFMAGLQKVHS
jgi:hypothetical protein